MKKKILDFIITLILIVLLFEILFNKALIESSISYSLLLWINTLIPSMFPFFVISDICIHYKIINYIPKFIKKTIGFLFQIPDEIVMTFFLSLISGFPSGARNIKTLYLNNSITEEDANQALLFTHFANPMFILEVVGNTFFNKKYYGYLILISHYLGNILIAILTRHKRKYSNRDYNSSNEKSQNFSTVFINSINSSINSLLMILGTLTCFLILANLIQKNINLNIYNETLLKGILEITMGLKSLSLINIPLIYKLSIATIFLSFGGFSVHLQVINELSDTKISYWYFFIARIFHAIISGIICVILFYLLG